MQHYICVTCGTQFATTAQAPEHCPICEDERQYVGHNGQQWTTLEALRSNHHNTFTELEPNLTAIRTEPQIAIGQRAHLIQTPAGNVLWESVTLVDDESIDRLKSLGGVDAIAISHPHFYSSMVEWSHAFNAPIYIHESERQWVMRPDDNIVFWQGETHPLMDNITLIRCGGHFEGAQVLHWADGAQGKGVLLSGDILMVAMDRRYVSFMYSYPNYIPLPASKVRKIVQAVEPFAYDRIYSPWVNKVMSDNAKERVALSAERYIKAISDSD